jgi:hypothetical protein
VDIEEELEDGSLLKFDKCVTSELHPVLLHTCQVSREIALKTYRLSFMDDLRFPVYFDIKKDVLSFDGFDTLCDFLNLSDNLHSFPEGRIPTLVFDLDAHASSWFDSSLTVGPRRIGVLS